MLEHSAPIPAHGVSSEHVPPSHLFPLLARVMLLAAFLLTPVVGFYVVRTTKASALQFVPVPPCRVIDTRATTGPLGGPFIGAGRKRALPVPASPCGIPPDARAYSANVTAIPRSRSLGYLTLWPTGRAQPEASTLNSPDGSVLANAAIVAAGTRGSINVYATSDTDLVLDINGYFVPPRAGTLQFYPVPPCRLVDTRRPSGSFGGPELSEGRARSFFVASAECGVPGNAGAYSLNVTVVPRGPLGYLSIWPAGTPQPSISTLNSLDGASLANAAIVGAGSGGAVSFFASNPTDVVVDINGYFAPPGRNGLNFYTVPPCRVADTRNPDGPLDGPILSGGKTRTFPAPISPCGLSATAAAYSLNMTVVPREALGYLTTWASGQPQPMASTLNGPKGLTVANAALVRAGAGGLIDVYVTHPANLIIDANGFFE